MNPHVIRSFKSPLQKNLEIEKLVWFSFKTGTEKQNKTELQGGEKNNYLLEMKIERQL